MSYRATLRKIGANVQSPGDLWLFAQIVLLATFLPLGLRVLPLPTVLRLLSPKRPAVRVLLPTDTAAAKRVQFTDYILRRNVWVYRPNCLKRSLLLYHFLQRAGMDVQIYLGVQRARQPAAGFAQGELRGHAWLVYRGAAVYEPSDEDLESFHVTYRYAEGVAKGTLV